ncbi:olfactory receptor 6N1-like [Aquarana catesbeiana]|uniref:olfactory receptor 6N1-like n=1 Tax=Aquarana catesbeiana TaxID=8400 RepID=UPI003CC987C4
MGAKFAPSVANAFMAQWEDKSVYKDTPAELTLYKRYIDDVIIVWNGKKEGLKQFLNKLNNNEKNIQWSWNIDEKSIGFLDLKIILERDKLITKTFFKNVHEDYLRSVVSSNATFIHVTEFIIFGFPSLQNYHIIDMTYTSVTIPKMLAKFLMKLDIISYNACFTQMYILLSLGATECFLLAIMAYDRYIAVCSPLHYQTIMTRQLYIILSMVAWSGGFAAPLTATLLALKLPFCGSNIIYHYYCDTPPLLQLACANTSFNVAIGSTIGAIVILVSFAVIVISYIKIILAILRISSHVGRKKTFSTCASHFTVVSIFFLPIMFMYIRPTASYSSDVDSLVSMLYTVLTPVMNPIIYSLRNKDIKSAFQKKTGFICTRSSLSTE